MKKIFLSLLISIAPVLAANAAPLELKAIYPSTLENQSPYGDSIKVMFNQKVHNSSASDPRIVSSQSIPSAPAGYIQNGNNLSARNAAKNYKITIIPESGSATTARSATWYALGGQVVYDPYDPEQKTVLFQLINFRSTDLFQPGDTVKIEVLTNITNTQGETMKTANFSTQKVAS